MRVFNIAGRSSVLRGMCRWSNERKEGKVVVKMEDDVSLEVIDHFLTFLYSGVLKGGESVVPSGRPVWIDLLPQLVRMAHKVIINIIFIYSRLQVRRLES